MTVRMFGYDIVKGEVEGSLSAGIGANFKLELESSAFDGTSVAIEAGVTVGLGAGGASKFKVYSDNLPRVAHAIYYTGYLTLMGDNMKRHAWETYFRNLEDNEVLFKKADEIIDQHLMQVFMDHQSLFASQLAWKQLEVLSLFKPTGRIPEIHAPARRPRRNAMIVR